MWSLIKSLFGMGPSVNYAEIIKSGGVVVDVRTPREYAGGHIAGAYNMPLNELSSKISKFKKDKPIITCCASGMRSASAKSILAGLGYAQVYNGGGWMSLNKKLS